MARHFDGDGTLSVQMSSVAARAGVSRATVSRTLSNPKMVSERTRQAVHAAIDELGYMPNVNAQILAARSTNEVGLLLRAPRNPTYGALYQHLQSYSSREGIDLISAVPSGGDDNGEMLALRRIVGTRPAGLLIATGSVRLEDVKRISRQIPTVFVPRPVDDPELNAVSFDEVAGAQTIAEAVVDHGHTKVAVATRPPGTSAVESLRTSTMISTLRDLGADVQVLLYDAPSGSESFEYYDPETDPRGSQLEDQILPDRTVLMFANDVQAAIHIAHMRMSGKIAGEELSITGFDGVEPLVSALGLATIAVPVRQASEEAINLISLLIKDPQRISERRKIPGRFRSGTSLAHL